MRTHQKMVAANAKSMAGECGNWTAIRTTLTVAMAGPADNSDGTSLKILTSQEVDEGGPADREQANPSHGFPVGDPPTKHRDAGMILGMQSATFTMLVNESLETSFFSMNP